MPANCSADIQAVISRIDDTIAGGNKTQIQQLKEEFGMGDVTHNDDFVSTCQ